MNTENAEATTPEVSRSSDLSEETRPSIYIYIYFYIIYTYLPGKKTFTSLQDTAFLGCS